MRDVTLEFLEEHKAKLDEVVYKRCSFVLEENDRVHTGCDALMAKNYAKFGQCIYASHYGLKDKYEVSCKELDLLVNLAA